MSDKLIISSKITMLLAAGVGVSIGITGYYYMKRIYQQKLSIPPSNWKLVGTINEILFYPIKSCGGISLNVADCDILGIKYGKCKDRELMLIDLNGEAVTARTYPKMLKIQPEIINGELFVSAPGMQTLKINFNKFANSTNGRSDIQAQLWDQTVSVTECDFAFYDKWFSQYILGSDHGLRLVYYPFPVATKSVSADFINGIFKNEDTGSLQDVSSYMLINNDSVNDLNEKLDRKVSNLNFRGNFAIKTISGEPYAEDKWNWIRIGETTIFRKIAPCYRCILPNVDPIAAEFYPNCQPLKTLKTYRIFGKVQSPQMGLQLGIRTTGIINMGDDVYVEDI